MHKLLFFSAGAFSALTGVSIVGGEAWLAGLFFAGSLGMIVIADV